MPNLECPHFVEFETSTWAVKFDRIWSLEFREIQLTELSNILVSSLPKFDNLTNNISWCVFLQNYLDYCKTSKHYTTNLTLLFTIHRNPSKVKSGNEQGAF